MWILIGANTGEYARLNVAVSVTSNERLTHSKYALFKDGLPTQERKLQPNGSRSNKKNVDMMKKQKFQWIARKR